MPLLALSEAVAEISILPGDRRARAPGRHWDGGRAGRSWWKWSRPTWLRSPLASVDLTR